MTHLFLQKRDQEVDGQHGILHDLVLVHVDVTNGNTEAKDLLELELDGRSDLVDFSAQVFSVGDGGREFASLGETGAEQTRRA